MASWNVRASLWTCSSQVCIALFLPLKDKLYLPPSWDDQIHQNEYFRRCWPEQYSYHSPQETRVWALHWCCAALRCTSLPDKLRTCRYDFLCLALWICSQIIAKCSMLCQGAPLHLSSDNQCQYNYCSGGCWWSCSPPCLAEQCLWSGFGTFGRFWDSFSFEMKVVTVVHHDAGMDWVFHAATISLHGSLRSPWACKLLYLDQVSMLLRHVEWLVWPPFSFGGAVLNFVKGSGT